MPCRIAGRHLCNFYRRPLVLRSQNYDTIEISSKDNLTLKFLYNTLPGRLFLKALIRPFTSKFFGLLADSAVSKLFIKGFIKKNKINIDEYKDTKYSSFNNFFSREVKNEYRPFPDNALYLASPCDGKLTAYQINEDSVFKIKDSLYDINGLLQDKNLSCEFTNGICLIFRLTPDDYHRYRYIDNGNILSVKKIKGLLHTVRPISQEKYNVFIQNAREYAVLQTENFGKVIQMEVGALFVGRIKNFLTNGEFKREAEKGMFEFGGSTVIMLFQKDKVVIDEAIFNNTLENKETVVKTGNILGKSAD